MPAELDFGEMYPKQEKKVKVELANLGQQTIRIVSILKSCSCTQAVLGAEMLEPGAGTYLELASVGAGRGMFENKVQLKWRINGTPEEHLSTIVIRGRVVDFLESESDIQDLGKIPQDGEPREIASVLKKGDAVLEWDGLKVSCEDKRVRGAVERLDANTYRLRLVLDPAGLPMGRYKTRIRVAGTLKGKELRDFKVLEVESEITGHLKISPPTLYWGAVASNANPKTMLIIQSDLPGALELVSVNGQKEAVEVLPAGNAQERRLGLWARISPGIKPGTHTGKLELNVRVKGFPQIQTILVPYIFSVK